MKQVVQSYKTGDVALRDVPVPQCGRKRILVRTRNSLISLGTERSTIELGRKSLVGKAAARPDLVRRAWDKARKEGLLKVDSEDGRRGFRLQRIMGCQTRPCTGNKKRGMLRS